MTTPPIKTAVDIASAHAQETVSALANEKINEVIHTSPLMGAGQAQTSVVQSTLSDRGKTHGDFRDNGKIMQDLKHVMRKEGKNWNSLPDHQKEALEMIQHKIGRILSGNNNEPDHWVDIAGYSQLIVNILNTGKSHV